MTIKKTLILSTGDFSHLPSLPSFQYGTDDKVLPSQNHGQLYQIHHMKSNFRRKKNLKIELLKTMSKLF